MLNSQDPAPEADAELALRRPHLEKAPSDLIADEAEFEGAQLQIGRTRIIAPFNAVKRCARTVLVKDGLKAGAQLIISDLATPVQGMPLKVDNGDGHLTKAVATAQMQLLSDENIVMVNSLSATFSCTRIRR